MTRLWFWFCLRHLWSYKGRGLLCLLGVALGVAVFVGIKTAASSATASFRDTVISLAGHTQLQVVGQGMGFPEEIYTRVASTPGVKAASPVLQFIVASANEPVLLLGVDLLSDRQFRDYQFASGSEGREALVRLLTQPDAIAVSKKFSRSHGLRPGDKMEILYGSRRVRFTVEAVMEFAGPARALEGNLAVVDIATAQEVFQHLGRLDRIDLLLEETASLKDLRAHLQRLLPADVRVERPERRLGRIEDMVGPYRLNLLALSLISLFVGVFLIYNAVAFAVSKRRYEIAMLRVLGMHRWQVLCLFLSEALVIGLLGGLLGVGLGLGIAKVALKTMARTISELYLLTRAENLSFSLSVILGGAGAALGVALLGALFPSLEASRTLPREALYRGSLERKLHTHLGKISLIGILLLGLAYLCSRQPPLAGIPLFGFFAAFLILAGFSFLTPAFVLVANTPLRALVALAFSIEGKLATRYLGGSLNRSAVAIAALMSALAMLVSISIMILSFRQTVVVWTDQVISADLYLSPAIRLTGQRGRLPPGLVDSLASLPGLAATERLREVQIHIDNAPVLLFVSDLKVKERFSRLLFQEGSSAEILRRCRELDQISISEVLAERLDLEPGDQLPLDTPSGRQSLTVAGVFYDYRTEGGMILMDRKTYHRFWPREPVYTSVGLYLKPGADPEQVRNLIRRSLAEGEQVLISSNSDLRRKILRIFDQTFSITYALQVIAIVVAIFGIVNTLILLITERERDIGVLKSVGASNGQILRMTLLEAGLMGLISFLLGAVGGVLLSLLLVFVINKQSFGWTIQFIIPPALFVKTLVMVLLCALIAGFAPARTATAKNVSEVMKLE